MSEEIEVIMNLLEEVLGEPKKVYETKLQYQFNCVECDEDRNKGNLEVSLEKHLYHCWSCNISGPLGKLFDEYGTKKQKKLYLLVRPEETEQVSIPKSRLSLPEGYTKISTCNKLYPPHKEGINYLKSRGITDEMCEKYNIGLTTIGKYSSRIIIPSYDKNGALNYFVARSWNPRAKQKYMNPKAEKDLIIFNETLIDWEQDIYLCEGVFDAIFLPNSVPMLGKHLSELLFTTLYNKTKKDIILCLDGDAFKQTKELYQTLNGGVLYNRIKVIKLPEDKDVCDLKGNISEFIYEIE